MLLDEAHPRSGAYFVCTLQRLEGLLQPYPRCVCALAAPPSTPLRDAPIQQGTMGVQTATPGGGVPDVGALTVMHGWSVSTRVTSLRCCSIRSKKRAMRTMDFS